LAVLCQPCFAVIFTTGDAFITCIAQHPAWCLRRISLHLARQLPSLLLLCTQIIYTIDNSSDSTTEWREESGKEHSLWTEPNSLLAVEVRPSSGTSSSHTHPPSTYAGVECEHTMRCSFIHSEWQSFIQAQQRPVSGWLLSGVWVVCGHVC
jgi:hypothetical protein